MKMRKMSKAQLRKNFESFGLTPREREIAPLIAAGNPRKIMADRLNISIRTIDTHLKNIRPKIGASSLFGSGCILSHYF
jgi:DNA-binding CsgD family transcriptional regulator